MKKLIQQFSQSIAWNFLDELADWTIQQGLCIQQIPAPTFQEDARAAYVAQVFQTHHLADVYIDEQKNVYGRLLGEQSQPALMVMAHTDTVFSADTDLSIRKEADLIYGPGLGDNSLGVAGMLGLLRYLHQRNIRPRHDIWFVATSCEEGLGDLNGVRAAFARLREILGAVINLEGLAFGHVYHAGIAVTRWHITAHTEGGHSWLHFGRPSAIHGLLELGAAICKLNPPANPRTTYNIGLIEGGQSINSIASQAGLWLDMRSEEQEALDVLAQRVYSIVQAAQRPDLAYEVKIVGNRPTGYIPSRHPLVQGALAALEEVGVRGSLECGSTDGNIPLHGGCPTVTIGITRGGNAHRLDEYIEITPVANGLRQLILLALASDQTLSQPEAH